MSAKIPEEVQNLWGQHFNAGDIDSLVSLFEPDAVFLHAPGQTVTGHAAIREKLQGWIASGMKANMQFQLALKHSNVALLYTRWTLSGTGADGKPMSMSGQTSDVVRQQADGTWKFIIDNPFGGVGADPA